MMLTRVMLSCTAHIHKIVPIIFFIKMSEALGLRKLSFMTVFLAPKIMLFKLMFIGPCVILIFEQR